MYIYDIFHESNNFDIYSDFQAHEVESYISESQDEYNDQGLN